LCELHHKQEYSNHHHIINLSNPEVNKIPYFGMKWQRHSWKRNIIQIQQEMDIIRPGKKIVATHVVGELEVLV